MLYVPGSVRRLPGAPGVKVAHSLLVIANIEPPFTLGIYTVFIYYDSTEFLQDGKQYSAQRHILDMTPQMRLTASINMLKACRAHRQSHIQTSQRKLNCFRVDCCRNRRLWRVLFKLCKAQSVNFCLQ